MAGPARTWHLVGEGADVLRLVNWLQSDVGKRTIAALDAGQISGAKAGAVPKAAPQIGGDVTKGEAILPGLCGRCHVVNDANRMNGLGSTPSFRVLRGLPGWQNRFESFFMLKPHAAFTQIDGVTGPFDPWPQPPIAPVRLSLADLEAIRAYAAGLEPADRVAPIQPRWIF